MQMTGARVRERSRRLPRERSHAERHHDRNRLLRFLVACAAVAVGFLSAGRVVPSSIERASSTWADEALTRVLRAVRSDYGR